MGASNIILQDLTIDATTSMTNGSFAVHIFGPASVLINKSGAMGAASIIEHAATGVGIAGPARVTIHNSTIQNTGSGSGGAVSVSGPSLVRLDGTTIQSNTAGAAVGADQGSMIQIVGGSITQGASAAAPAIRLLNSSSAKVLGGATVTGPDVGPAVFAAQNSAVFVDPDSAISTSGASTAGPVIVAIRSSSAALDGATVTGAPFATNDTILAALGSSVLLHGSTVTSEAFVAPTIQASANSSVVLAGGNTIEDTVSGFALQVDHSSSLFENDGTLFGFTGAADSITGDGIVQVESSMQLGTGGATPSTWTGNIKVRQNSAFLMGGGMTVTGFVHLEQASNGFFNTANGGTNTVSGAVSCPATMGNSASHVANPTQVTPNVVVGATFDMTTPPACLQF